MTTTQTLRHERDRDAQMRLERERDEAQRKDDLRWLMRDPTGRRIAYRIWRAEGPLFSTNNAAMSRAVGVHEFKTAFGEQLRAASHDHFLMMQHENDHGAT